MNASLKEVKDLINETRPYSEAFVRWTSQVRNETSDLSMADARIRAYEKTWRRRAREIRARIAEATGASPEAIFLIDETPSVKMTLAPIETHPISNEAQRELDKFVKFLAACAFPLTSSILIRRCAMKGGKV